MLCRPGVFSESRNVVMYLTRMLRGDSSQQIGEYFQMSKYSSVSSMIERVKAEIAHNRRLEQRTEKLLSWINKSQEQT